MKQRLGAAFDDQSPASAAAINADVYDGEFTLLRKSYRPTWNQLFLVVNYREFPTSFAFFTLICI